MEPIVTIHSFNEAYAELAAVSITSLVHNNPTRDCHVHIFENSLGRETIARILTIEQKYANAKITVHHIPDEAFAEVADGHYGGETWYPMLAPEMLRDCNKALVLEPDTLVCRDISELFDMDLGESPLACHLRKPTRPVHLVIGKPSCFNAGVLLLNLKCIRKNDTFNMKNLSDAVRMLRLRYSDTSLWIAQESYLNHVLDHETLLRYSFRFNCFLLLSFLLFHSSDIESHEISIVLSNPAIIHFAGHKPNSKTCMAFLNVVHKWWEYHALSPFADSQRDAARVQEIIEYRNGLRNSICSFHNYFDYLLLDDLLGAIEKLKQMAENGTQIVFYGIGQWGTGFARIARAMGLHPDKICDRGKCGTAIDGVGIEPPDILKSDNGNTIVVVAIAEPQTMTEVKNTLLGFGIPEHHILPVFEQLALGGRRWNEILASVHL